MNSFVVGICYERREFDASNSQEIRRRGKNGVCSQSHPLFTDLFDEFGFQTHFADARNFTVDVMVAADEANIFHLGADLDHKGWPLHFQVFDDRDRVAIF